MSGYFIRVMFVMLFGAASASAQKGYALSGKVYHLVGKDTAASVFSEVYLIDDTGGRFSKPYQTLLSAHIKTAKALEKVVMEKREAALSIKKTADMNLLSDQQRVNRAMLDVEDAENALNLLSQAAVTQIDSMVRSSIFYSAYTDMNGIYEYTDLAPGKYSLYVRLPTNDRITYFFSAVTVRRSLRLTLNDAALKRSLFYNRR